ncbi:hypothetical protein [Nocardiopsis lucentensis]|uniref:hypothetical protein n=1 Tax=Nocardiopsis lucentensis TaxID=53441 RepID=UPI000344E6FB|nr:hypothetical protein [Nocardiopsis lucentensis]
MRTGTDVLHATDWSRLLQADGTADEVPEALAAFLERDEAGWHRALDHLYEQLLGDDGVYPATVPAVLFVSGLLDHPVADAVPPWDGPWPRTLRGVLLEFLCDAARHARWDDSPDEHLAAMAEVDGDLVGRFLQGLVDETGEDDEEDGDALDFEETEEAHGALLARAALDLRAAAPALYDLVRPHLTHEDRHVRQRAAEAAGELAWLGGLELDLSDAADLAETRDEGAAIVLALGRNGRDTSEFLTHPDPAIRACAALAPSLRGDPAATEELAAVLTHAEEVDSWFSTRPRCFDGPVRSALVWELGQRWDAEDRDAADLLPVARAVVRATDPDSLSEDLGALYGALFRLGDGARWRTEDLGGVQRDYLRVLVDDDRLWSHADDRSEVMRRAWELMRDEPEPPGWRWLDQGDLRRFLDVLGLPRDREGLRKLVDG